MLTLQSRLRPNEEEVAGKVMDGEAIIINLSNGIYYSMDKVGGFIWEMVERRHSLETIVELISTRYDVSTEQARADVERLVGQLVEENLVKGADGEVPKGEGPGLGVEEKLVYESPQLNIYRDMGDLLALDPPTPGLENTPWKEPDDKGTR